MNIEQPGVTRSPGEVEVTQADRDAAADIIEKLAPSLIDRDRWLLSAEALRRGHRGYIEHDGIAQIIAAAPTPDRAASSSEVDRIAGILMAAWAKAEPDHDVTKYPVSYVATFADLARAVVADRAASAQEAEAETYRQMRDIAVNDLGYPGILEALEACPPASAKRFTFAVEKLPWTARDVIEERNGAFDELRKLCTYLQEQGVYRGDDGDIGPADEAIAYIEMLLEDARERPPASAQAKVHKTGNNYVVADQVGWLPGVYASEAMAQVAATVPIDQLTQWWRSIVPAASAQAGEWEAIAAKLDRWAIYHRKRYDSRQADALEQAATALRAVDAPPKGVPSGWKLVPVEPTHSMLCVALRGFNAREIWSEMLAAAPATPAIDPAQDVQASDESSITDAEIDEALSHGFGERFTERYAVKTLVDAATIAQANVCIGFCHWPDGDTDDPIEHVQNCLDLTAALASFKAGKGEGEG